MKALHRYGTGTGCEELYIPGTPSFPLDQIFRLPLAEPLLGDGLGGKYLRITQFIK